MPLPKADVIMMGHILHGWNLPQKRHLVRAAFDALPSGGAFIVYEALIDDARCQNAFGLLMSLNMLIETPGGFDFTGTDAIGWMKEAGFSEAYTQHLVGLDSMVVASSKFLVPATAFLRLCAFLHRYDSKYEYQRTFCFDKFGHDRG